MVTSQKKSGHWHDSCATGISAMEIMENCIVWDINNSAPTVCFNPVFFLLDTDLLP